MSSIARQERSRKLMCLRLRTEMIEQAGDMDADMFRDFGEASHWRMKVEVSHNVKVWSKSLAPSGLLRKPIEFHGASFIPLMVPPSTLEASYGPGIVQSNTGEKCWARLEKRGRKWAILYIEGPLS